MDWEGGGKGSRRRCEISRQTRLFTAPSTISKQREKEVEFELYALCGDGAAGIPVCAKTHSKITHVLTERHPPPSAAKATCAHTSIAEIKKQTDANLANRAFI